MFEFGRHNWLSVLFVSVCPTVEEFTWRALAHLDIFGRCLLPATKWCLMHLRSSLASPRRLFNGSRLRLAPRVVASASALPQRTHLRLILRQLTRAEADGWDPHSEDFEYVISDIRTLTNRPH